MALYKSKQMGENHFSSQKTPKCSDFVVKQEMFAIWSAGKNGEDNKET